MELELPPVMSILGRHYGYFTIEMGGGLHRWLHYTRYGEFSHTNLIVANKLAELLTGCSSLPSLLQN